jgi:hypothetical protein
MVNSGLAVLVLLSLGVLAITDATAAAGPEAQQKPDTRPAGEVYKNLKMEILQRAPVARVDRIMQVMNKVLGVECVHCHEQDNWAKDDLSEEQMHARKMMVAKMFPMVMSINQTHFEGKGGPTCWTCHRGSTKPEGSPADGWKPRPAPEPSPFKSGEGTAGEVYENIKVFQQMPAARLSSVMGVLTAALGVKCTHCHVKGDWASDKKEPKQTARKMFAMRGAIQAKYFPDKRGALSCWTCHRGSTEPEKNPPR